MLARRVTSIRKFRLYNIHSYFSNYMTIKKGTYIIVIDTCLLLYNISHWLTTLLYLAFLWTAEVGGQRATASSKFKTLIFAIENYIRLA